jgi:hypothetical protein
MRRASSLFLRPRHLSASAPRLLVVMLLLAIGLTACGGGDDAKTKKKRAPAVGTSLAELTRVAGSIGHPIYWAGPRGGTRYELSRTKDGRVFIRYLPPGVKLGDPKPNYLSVGTYPQADAFKTLTATAKKQGVPTIKLRGGGLAFADKSHPTSVYLAYPGADYQIEVYDPSAARARQLVSSGKIVPVGIATAGHAGARAATAAQLSATASQALHPIYWAGPKSDTTYELTRTTDGRVYIRYLPAGVKVGDVRPNYLTVGTYPQTDALKTLRATAEKNKSETIELDDGGLASVAKKPTSVYVAYPGRDLLIEVYDPDPARARELVTSGRIVRIR